MVAGADGGEAGVDGDAIELAADVELGSRCRVGVSRSGLSGGAGGNALASWPGR